MSSWEAYQEQGRKHVGADRKIDQEEVRIIQKRVDTMARALVKMFRIGEEVGGRNAERVMDAYSSESCVVPALTVNPKDHKPCGEDGQPVTRPVCSAQTCANGDWEMSWPRSLHL